MWKAIGVIGEGSDSFPIVEKIEAKKRGIRCAVYSKPLKLTVIYSLYRPIPFRKVILKELERSKTKNFFKFTEKTHSIKTRTTFVTFFVATIKMLTFNHPF